MRRYGAYILSIEKSVLPRAGIASLRYAGCVMPSGASRTLSTRLNIVEQSLDDTIQRLRDLPPCPIVRELRAKADGYARALHTWTVKPPTQEQRATLLRLVLDLNVQAMAVGRDPQ
jgi:hypothetical protein